MGDCKEMFVRETYADFKVKDSKTFHQHRAIEIGLQKYVDIVTEKESKKARVQVQNVDAEPLKWSEEMEVWLFEANVSFKVIDEEE